MKKLLFTLFSIVFLFSCSESAKDIDPKKIDNACDFVDAVGTVTDEMIDLMERYEDKDESDIPDSDREEMDLLEEKMDKLEDVMKEEWEDEIEDCKNFKKVDGNLKKLGIR
ncbi:MAG: hypothetical protein P8J34_03130 [Flavobacteriales bacterium]|nr:hypothetical protein [Flavobacteriales bacterium]